MTGHCVLMICCCRYRPITAGDRHRAPRSAPSQRYRHSSIQKRSSSNDKLLTMEGAAGSVWIDGLRRVRLFVGAPARLLSSPLVKVTLVY